MKKISLLIPVYNTAAYINRCVMSLARQSIGISELEIVLINDASTDNSLDYLYAWEKEFPDSICVINLDENVKQGAARNLALQYTTGEYIAYLDSDDWLVPQALEYLYTVAKQSDAEIVAYLSKDVSVEEQQQKGEAIILENDIDSGLEDEYLTIRNTADRLMLFFGGKSQRGCWDKLYKRGFVIEHNLRYAEGVFDEESLFTIPALMHVKKYYLMNKYLHRYSDNPMGTCSNLSQKMEHLHDNELTWMQVYDVFRREGSLKKEPELTEALFVHNYFNRSLIYAHVAGMHYDADGIRHLQKTVKRLFPRYRDNPVLINMRSFPYMERLLNMKIDDGDTESFYKLLSEWEKVVGSEV
ncbi:MAG: glycosyltransferase [Lachnospiraceae bacterium]|nr:glycosyltransferase [Lachnospiraceae bacterium]